MSGSLTPNCACCLSLSRYAHTNTGAFIEGKNTRPSTVTRLLLPQTASFLVLPPQKKNGSCTSPITNVLERWIVPSGTAATGRKSTHKCGQARAQAMPVCVLFQKKKKKKKERANRHEASTKKGEATPRGKGKKR